MAREGSIVPVCSLRHKTAEEHAAAGGCGSQLAASRIKKEL